MLKKNFCFSFLMMLCSIATQELWAADYLLTITPRDSVYVVVSDGLGEIIFECSNGVALDSSKVEHISGHNQNEFYWVISIYKDSDETAPLAYIVDFGDDTDTQITGKGGVITVR